ncbi:4-hydroxy-tetrahydrodipicolinate synthase [Candidatus Persebacteraceae bacterium Df01]|jgi:4-hydroxy-tetrahydrodipicolinate synthase|uniref:4-hydroxy-tetrahydrodipicolinate synthase n=1 Tax=Candidatus Doriopsillibacter californiensis TaxID=2970740 RepID=A0ABT7QN07_9GAMM|nr:4-hydroxy-tetrahydrodipicolinate synthase [Candidatus Persebacteraceae bacterium Df01]
MSHFNVRGSIVAIVTPMREDDSVDNEALKKLLVWHLESQTQAIVAAGTTGESPTLSMKENQRLIADTVQWSSGRIPIIAGVGSNATAEAVLLTRRAAADGANAGLSVIPYYNNPTQEGLFRHFSTVANCSDMPIIIYDVPGRCVASINTDTLERLAQHPNIIGIKDATGNQSLAKERFLALPENFLFYSGNDSTACAYMLTGGHGVISVTANVAPLQMQQMSAAALAGDVHGANAKDAHLQPFHLAQGIESNPIPVKWVLADEGRIAPTIRLPLIPLAERYHETVRQAVIASRQTTLRS